MEGFEWDKPFQIKKVSEISEICHPNYVIPKTVILTIKEPTLWELLKKIVKKILNK